MRAGLFLDDHHTMFVLYLHSMLARFARRTVRVRTLDAQTRNQPRNYYCSFAMIWRCSCDRRELEEILNRAWSENVEVGQWLCYD